MPAPPPPPPPGITTLSSFNTVLMGTPGAEKQHCMHCHIELIPGDAYCHNCGAPTGRSEITQQPTRLVEPSEEAKQHKIPSPTKDQETPLDRLPTVEANEPDNPTHLEEKDGGV
jgi:hypothetical protein